MKQCKKCKLLKPYIEFNKNRTCRDKHYPYCKVCKKIDDRAYNQGPGKTKAWKRKYGIEEYQIIEMLLDQRGLCGVADCGEALDMNTRWKFNVDHCHTTGKVRGLLCMRCNIVLGHVRDRCETLNGMVDYLNGKKAGYGYSKEV